MDSEDKMMAILGVVMFALIALFVVRVSACNETVAEARAKVFTACIAAGTAPQECRAAVEVIHP